MAEMVCREIVVHNKFFPTTTLAVRTVRKLVGDCKSICYNYTRTKNHRTITVRCSNGKRIYVRLIKRDDGWELLNAEVCEQQ